MTTAPSTPRVNTRSHDDVFVCRLPTPPRTPESSSCASTGTSSGSRWQPAKHRPVARPTRCFVRVAPIGIHPGDEDIPTAVECNGDGRTIELPAFVAHDGRQRMALSTAYDGCFEGGAAATENVYREVGKPLVELALQGKASCLLAYGQTGAGKSHNVWQILLPSTIRALFASGVAQVDVAVVQLYMDRM